MFDESHKQDPSPKQEGAKEESLDVIEELEALEKEQVKGTRGAYIDKKTSKGLTIEQKRLLKIMIAFSTIFIVWASWKAYALLGNAKEKETLDVIQNHLPEIKQEELQKKEQAILKSGDGNATVTQERLVKKEEVPNEKQDVYQSVLERRLKSGLVNSEHQHVPERKDQKEDKNSFNEEGRPGSNLEKKLEPLVLKTHQAARLKKRDMLLTQGVMLDCQLETRIISTQPGMTSCYTTRDTYSSSGRVVLIDKGSKVVGHYDGGITQGSARIFIVWDRIETPSGVVVSLDSPGTGPLGEAGIGGWVDNHFRERFGGAILISLIGDLGEFVANLGNRDSKNRIQFTNTNDGTQQAATEVLKHSLNIQPTLYKNQGERISIFVARDLNFSHVYELKRQY